MFLITLSYCCFFAPLWLSYVQTKTYKHDVIVIIQLTLWTVSKLFNHKGYRHPAQLIVFTELSPLKYYEPGIILFGL